VYVGVPVPLCTCARAREAAVRYMPFLRVQEWRHTRHAHTTYVLDDSCRERPRTHWYRFLVGRAMAFCAVYAGTGHEVAYLRSPEPWAFGGCDSVLMEGIGNAKSEKQFLVNPRGRLRRRADAVPTLCRRCADFVPRRPILSREAKTQRPMIHGWR
jgi:hypothetical protein